MKRLLLLISILGGLGLLGPVFAASVARDTYIVQPHLILLDEPQNVGVLYWREEIGKYDPTAVIVFGHGIMVGPTWCVSRYDGAIAPVKTVVDLIRNDYPHQRIYLLICNPSGISLDSPGVSYAKVNVWKFPDTYFLRYNTLDDMFDVDNAGGLDEFVHNPL